MEKKGLFDGYKFNSKVELKNRIVMAPMTTWSGKADGNLSDEEEAYYSARSEGPSMLITAACAIDLNAQAFAGQISARSDAFLPSLRRLARSIKSKGSLAILQIHHGGRMCPEGMHPDAEVVSASTIPAERPGSATPKELSNKEILTLINTHVEVVSRAYEAGFDGVELHGANTYLLQQFVSPHSNRRTDRWGGNLENRMRFPLEIVKQVSTQIKTFDRAFILGYRFSPEEVETPGLTLEDTHTFIDALSKTKLDYLHISIGHFAASSIRESDNSTPVAKEIIDTINGRKPLIGVGKITTKQEAEEALALGYDFVAIGSSFIANPDWVHRIQSNKEIATEIYVDECQERSVPTEMFEMLYKLNRMRGDWPGIALKK